MGHSQSDTSASPSQLISSSSFSSKECHPGTLILNPSDIPSSSKPVAMNGSSSTRSLQLSQSMPHPSNPTATASSSTSAAAVSESTDRSTEQAATHAHFPQRRNLSSRSSKGCKLNMKRSGSHPNSLSNYVQSLTGATVKNATVVATEPLMQPNAIVRSKSPESRSDLQAFPPKAGSPPRKLSMAIFEDTVCEEEETSDAGTSAADALMKAEKQFEEKAEKDCVSSTIQAKSSDCELPELQMKDQDENSQMEKSASTRSLSAMSVASDSPASAAISSYLYHYSSEALLYFFDWDDTLLCSSYLRHLNYSLHSEWDELDEEFRLSLQQLDDAISNLFSVLFNNVTKNIFIITNSETGWVERSAMKFLPKTHGFFNDVNFFSNIISARDMYCRTVPEAASKYAQCLKNLQSNNSFYQANNLAHISAAMSQPLQWKEFVFEKTVKEWIKENQRTAELEEKSEFAKKTDDASAMKTERKEQKPIHVVCMGDTVERTAIINALSSIASLARSPVTLFPNSHNGNASVGEGDSQPMYGPSVDEAFEICKLLSERKMILKSIKFPERPHVTQLEKQINLIGSVVNYLSTHTQPLDLYLSLAVMNNNNNQNNTTGNSASKKTDDSHKPCSSSTVKAEPNNSCRVKENSASAMHTTEVAV